MRYIFNKFRLMALAVVLSLSACETGFEEMNIDPNEPAEVPAGFLLASAQKQLMDELWDQWNNGRFGMLYAQYWAQNEYTDESRYQFRPNVNNAFWTSMYANVLQDLQEIIRLNQENDLGAQSANQIAVAKILKAYTFQILTDVYGPVPYFEALKVNEVVSPSYTPQPEIYADLVKELTEASNMIVTTAPGFPTGDLIYGSNMANWKKFANSLKMRVAIRMADVNATAAGTAINEALTAGVFTSVAESAVLNYLEAQPNTNPLYLDRLTRADFAVSNVLVEALQERNDPRLPIFAEPNANGNFVGLTYGLTQAAAGAIPNSAVSQPGKAVLQTTSPAILMLYDEVLFIRAEAAQRGFVTGDASQLFKDAIAASLRFWSTQAVNPANTLSATQIQNYANGVQYNSANWRQSVGTQKWIALYMQGIQGWIEWRRLDFGLLQMPAAGPLLGTGIPTRHIYPDEEQNLNRQNYTTALSALGNKDEMGGKVWWDVQ